MSSLDNLQAFKRHSRAQSPSVRETAFDKHANLKLPYPPKASKSRVLSVQSTPSWVSQLPAISEGEYIGPGITTESAKSAATSTIRSRIDSLQWVELVQLGTLVQGKNEHLICHTRSHKELYMLKNVGHELDKNVERAIGLRHENIFTASFMIRSDSSVYIGFDYARHTLEELLCVHLAMDEVQIQAIATSVFAALKFLNKEGFAHGSVDVGSIRVCNRSGRVMLSDCESSFPHRNVKPEADLERLGLVLLDCMEGVPRCFNVEQVREQRAVNKVFGLSKPERWSGQKQLVDFVDDLFSRQRKAETKLARPHAYVEDESRKRDALRPLLELASIECLAIWHAAE